MAIQVIETGYAAVDDTTGEIIVLADRVGVSEQWTVSAPPVSTSSKTVTGLPAVDALARSVATHYLNAKNKELEAAQARAAASAALDA
jgi:hypothetical protein